VKVGDLVTWANSDRRRIGVIVETGLQSWDMRKEVVRVQWSDGHCFEYHVRDLLVINERR
jgi:hypothetical protein